AANTCYQLFQRCRSANRKWLAKRRLERHCGVGRLTRLLSAKPINFTASDTEFGRRGREQEHTVPGFGVRRICQENNIERRAPFLRSERPESVHLLQFPLGPYKNVSVVTESGA